LSFPINHFIMRIMYLLILFIMLLTRM
jgi:hypothetical protein